MSFFGLEFFSKCRICKPALNLEVNCVGVKQCYVVCNNCSGHDNFCPDDPYKDTFKEVVWPLSDRPYLKKLLMVVVGEVHHNRKNYRPRHN